VVDTVDKGVAVVLAAALTTGANVAPTAKREALDAGFFFSIGLLAPHRISKNGTKSCLDT